MNKHPELHCHSTYMYMYTVLSNDFFSPVLFPPFPFIHPSPPHFHLPPASVVTSRVATSPSPAPFLANTMKSYSVSAFRLLTRNDNDVPTLSVLVELITLNFT